MSVAGGVSFAPCVWLASVRIFTGSEAVCPSAQESFTCFRLRSAFCTCSPVRNCLKSSTARKFWKSSGKGPKRSRRDRAICSLAGPSGAVVSSL